MYEISKSDFEKLERDMHVEISRLLRRYVMVRADRVEETADQVAPVPEKKKRGRKPKSDDEKRVDREIGNITIAGQEKKKRGRPKKVS